MKRNFISIDDWTAEEIRENFNLAKELKDLTKQKKCPQELKDKNYGLVFHKNSLRTRLSFEVGINQLGGNSFHITKNDFELGKRESNHDVAKVMSRYLDGILIRTYDHKLLEEIGEHAEIPVVNMLTDWSHPCQIMTDAFTIEEKLGQIENLKIVYLGDGNNIVHSWLNLAKRIPLHFCIATSPNTLPDMELLKSVQNAGISKVTITHSPEKGVKDADVLYTDVWASMGQKEQLDCKVEELSCFQINQSLLNKAKPSAIVMHCLPAERGREITDEVMDGPQSVVFDQAENRLHVQKAILVQLNRWLESK